MGHEVEVNINTEKHSLEDAGFEVAYVKSNTTCCGLYMALEWPSTSGNDDKYHTIKRSIDELKGSLRLLYSLYKQNEIDAKTASECNKLLEKVIAFAEKKNLGHFLFRRSY